jgi:hypothetical protein
MDKLPYLSSVDWEKWIKEVRLGDGEVLKMLLSSLTQILKALW